METPPPLPAPVKRPPFEEKSLWWLIFFDAAWSFEEIVLNVASVILAPVCFFGTAIPVFVIQCRAGDAVVMALAKAFLCGFLAALPFPVAGTAFGASVLAWIKLRTGR